MRALHAVIVGTPALVDDGHVAVRPLLQNPRRLDERAAQIAECVVDTAGEEPRVSKHAGAGSKVGPVVLTTRASGFSGWWRCSSRRMTLGQAGWIGSARSSRIVLSYHMDATQESNSWCVLQ